MVDRLLLKNEVVEAVGLRYPTLHKMMKRGQFPRSIIIGNGSIAKVAWKESEIQNWIDTRARSSFIGDPGREETAADRARQEAGRRGGLARAKRMKRRRLSQ